MLLAYLEHSTLLVDAFSKVCSDSAITEVRAKLFCFFYSSIASHTPKHPPPPPRNKPSCEEIPEGGGTVHNTPMSS